MDGTVRVKSLVWFATGVVVTLLATVIVMQTWRADAAPGESDTTFVPITPGCRFADTRQPGQGGPIGDGQTRQFTAHGVNNDCTIPTDAVAVLMNVTADRPTASNSFLSIWGNGANPGTSALNPAAGQPPTPNAVTTDLTGAGVFNVYNDAGTVDLIIDINGYYTKASLTELASRLTDVYTKSEVDSLLGDKIGRGAIVLRHGTGEMTPNWFALPSSLKNYGSGTEVSGDGIVNISPAGPVRLDGTEYGLKSFEYCIENVAGGAKVSAVTIAGDTPITVVTDSTPRTQAGCYTVDEVVETSNAYDIVFELSGGGSLEISGLQTTWVPLP